MSGGISSYVFGCGVSSVLMLIGSMLSMICVIVSCGSVVLCDVILLNMLFVIIIDSVFSLMLVVCM